MRSVNKGAAPRTYTDYKDARNDLADRIGWYCSYCEMPVSNMIEIEHVHPVANGGNELDWGNFLLSCKYCNTVKLNHNADRRGYLWPDIDNTILAFRYSEARIVEPATDLPDPIRAMAASTIRLMGLDRTPGAGGEQEPTERDSRWIKRIEARGIIDESFSNWRELPQEAMARQIAQTAHATGFYSLWIARFAGIAIVLDQINAHFRGVYIPEYDEHAHLVVRTGGSF